jgi:NTE family protein
MRHHRIDPRYRCWVAALLALLFGCAGARAVNVPLERYSPTDAGRPRQAPMDPGEAVIYLAFSGGGTRAAAFAYGVMEELHATTIGVGAATTLLEEIDTISGVSGGSFPAAYYGVFGDRIFEDFEARFLKRNVQGALLLRVLRPWNLFQVVFTPWLSRSDLAARYYDENVFDGASFADLHASGGPRIYINATDLSSGTRVTFNRDTFELICSDLDQLPISVAVAASSAVPMLLSPISMRNYAGRCDYEPPEWARKALEDPGSNRRIRQSARSFADFADAENKPFIHLIDGGISDNLGLRASIDFLTTVGGAKAAIEARAIDVPKLLAVIVVNAETDPNWTIDLSSAAPSFAQLMNSVAGSQIRRYNLETLVTMESLLASLRAELAESGNEMQTFMVDVSFDEVEDPGDRTYLKRLPTSFVLTDGEVDELREAGRRLLRESAEFQALVEALR